MREPVVNAEALDRATEGRLGPDAELPCDDRSEGVGSHRLRNHRVTTVFITLTPDFRHAHKTGQEDRLNVGELLVTAELGKDFSPIERRHYDVEHDEVGVKFASDFDSLGGVVDRNHFVHAGALEEPNDDVGHGRFVVYDQDALPLSQAVLAGWAAFAAMSNQAGSEARAERTWTSTLVSAGTRQSLSRPRKSPPHESDIANLLGTSERFWLILRLKCAA